MKEKCTQTDMRSISPLESLQTELCDWQLVAGSSHTLMNSFTLRFLCDWRSGGGGGLRPRFDGRPVVTWSAGRTFLHQPRRTQVVDRGALVREVCGGEAQKKNQVRLWI